ncbi:MAG: hypothetical protein DHS80DRAFT_17933 [Piptocephalis tieghemiana]|nr:MAG: hypothetical protein DHS80DRAFT_17933 [Piptocephalis tieghemiana]
MHSVDSGKVYRVEYDTKVLLQLGTAFRAFVRDSAIRIAATEALRHTLVSGLVSALTWPMGLLKAGEIIIDPPWVLALERAKKAGLVLADVIASHAQGHRPISLIGYSTGALAIHTCLLELSKRGLYGHVDHAILIGTPVSNQGDTHTHTGVRRACAGECVNVYSHTHTHIAFLFRVHAMHVRGIAHTHTQDGVKSVRNLDVTSLVGGHLEYKEHLPRILHRIHGIIQEMEGPSSSSDDRMDWMII